MSQRRARIRMSVAVAALMAGTLVAAVAGPAASAGRSPSYQVWASDQSNSVAGEIRSGVDGSYLWIWNSDDIEAQLANGTPAQPLGCDRRNPAKASVGPCDLHDVFPGSLVEVGLRGRPTGKTLDELDGFGRLHGMLPDPSGRYVTANIFAPGGGYVGVIDTQRRAAVGLFRVSGTNVGGGTDVRSVHMSFWSEDGRQILIANLNGKLLERIDVFRTGNGRIRDLVFNRSATLGVGKGMEITAPATAFTGRNQQGQRLLGRVAGSYKRSALDDLTPNGVCKENGCEAGPDGAAGGRPNNVIICPIPTDGRRVYITPGGGGLLVADSRRTPMRIVGEYGREVINGAGCGGVETGKTGAPGTVWLNAGVSASGAGATWSTFTVYTIDDNAFARRRPLGENQPSPNLVFADPANTATGGSAGGPSGNDTGQLPGTTTRRDSHGMAATIDDAYLHVVDRIQNVMEVFDVETQTLIGSYDLTSADGQGNGVGPCEAASVTDDPGLPTNDPAPDLFELTPDGKYLMVAFRGPAPVSVTHSAQGSCPGVGVIELLDGGRSGRLVGVLRSTNTVADNPASAPGGWPYSGAERSDIHGATVVPPVN